MADIQGRLLVISNEPAPYFKNIAERLEPSNHVSYLRVKDAVHGDVLARSRANYALVDLTDTDEYVLSVIGRLQDVGSNWPLICLSPRLPADSTLLSREGSFLFLHPQLTSVTLPHSPQRPIPPLRSSFRGEFQAESLLEVVQLLLLAGVSGRLVVWRRWSRGEVWFHDGYVVHAELGERRGRAALRSLLEWIRGTFRLQMGMAPTLTLKIGLTDPLLQSVTSPSSIVDGSALLDAEVRAIRAARDSASASSSDPEIFVSSDSVAAIRAGFVEPEVELDVVTAMPSQATASSASSVDEITSIESAHALPLPEPSMASFPLRDDAQSLEQVERSLEQAWLQEATNAVEVIEQSVASKEDEMAVTSNTVKDTLSKLEQSVEGFIGAAVADSDSGMCLGWSGGSGILNIELAAAGNTEVVRAKRKIMKGLNLRDEIDDILISLGKQYHLIRPLRTRASVFIYLAVDRARANLAMARFALADAERDLGL